MDQANANEEKEMKAKRKYYESKTNYCPWI
jgi:hypothetical protein